MPALAGDIVVQLQKRTSQAKAYAALSPADEKQWRNKPLQTAIGTGDTLRFSDVPPGRYAVQLFVDNNGNGKLDTSDKLGIPREPVGFSNNPSLFEGQPSPGKAGFDHGQQDTLVPIKLHNPRVKQP
jgi:uncharacterized protein (DUF2141 family)